MIRNEYLTVREISSRQSMSTRNVRRIIGELKKEKGEHLLYKDHNNYWMVHHLLEPNFKLQRKRREKYYALNIDPHYNYSRTEIDEIMRFIIEQMKGITTEIHYTVEQKKSNAHLHIHSYIKCSNKNKLLKWFKIGFSKVSYQEAEIFDLEGWKNYITKEGNEINTIKN